MDLTHLSDAALKSILILANSAHQNDLAVEIVGEMNRFICEIKRSVDVADTLYFLFAPHTHVGLHYWVRRNKALIVDAQTAVHELWKKGCEKGVEGGIKALNELQLDMKESNMVRAKRNYSRMVAAGFANL